MELDSGYYMLLLTDERFLTPIFPPSFFSVIFFGVLGLAAGCCTQSTVNQSSCFVLTPIKHCYV